MLKQILDISFICLVKTYLVFIGVKEINLFLWKIQKLQEIKNKWRNMVRPKLKLSLFPQTRPTRDNRPDSNNFFAICSKNYFFLIFCGTTVTGLLFNNKMSYERFLCCNFFKAPSLHRSQWRRLACETWRADERASFVVISIETVKLASSQHRFYFDVHKVCGKLGQGKTALGGW